MIRLIIIRFFESTIRNIFIVLTPAIIVTLLVIAFQAVQKPQYLSGATIQIRYNAEISEVVGYEKFEAGYLDPSEILIIELYELLQTNAFVDEIISQVDFTDHTGINAVANTPDDLREYLRDNVEYSASGVTQIGVIAYMPTPTSSVEVVNAIYNVYLDYQIETYGGTGRDLVNFMGIYLEAKVNQLDLVNAELDAYLESHPVHPLYDRREIEETQIEFLTNARNNLVEDIENTNDVLELGFLVEETSERYFKETFILLDAPFDPIPMTSNSKKVSNIIQGTIVGSVLSLMVIGALIIFDKRITLPLDLKNATDLPLLTMVQMEKGQHKGERRTLVKRAQDRLKQIIIFENVGNTSNSKSSVKV